MKKVLLGLLALSAVSMAAAPDLTQDGTAGTNVFQTGQEGAISITGKLTSDVPVVKYVVYASPDGTASKEDTLALNEFILSQDASKAGFQVANPKVYVKRVEGTAGEETYKALEAGDKISFKIEVDSTYTELNTKNWMKETEELEFGATSILSKVTLDEVIAAAGISGSLDGFGNIIVNGKFYGGGSAINLNHQTNGELTISSPTLQPDANQMTDLATIRKIETAFAGGKAISNAKILVKVD